MNRRKICVVTSTRAEYGLLRWVMEGIRQTPELELSIIATGMHLSPEFGLTYREIEKDGFIINRKVEMLLSSDTPTGISKSMGLGLIGFGEALSDLKPDLVLVLGDRFEIFCFAAAATIARIPVAHIQGGETTEGAFDEAFRHSITKMSQLHFVAAQSYRERVIQLGENPKRVFMVGGLGVDNIKKLPLLDRPALERDLGLTLSKKNLLITFHPVTLEESSAQQMKELLLSLGELKDTKLIFTMPNSDTGNRILFNMINDFIAQHPNAHAFTSLGQLRYLSCMKHMDGVVGNSSSGLMEAPSFGIGTINIGDRQKGRLKAVSVIDCDPDQKSITTALKRLYSKAFVNALKTVRNPYGKGGASDKILKIIQEYPMEYNLKKIFYNIEMKNFSKNV